MFVGRAVLALATLGIGTPASRELLRVMLQFLPAGALVSGRPWLPMGAAKLAAIAGITERTLARRMAELRALGLLERHLDQWNHPARAEDGSRCGGSAVRGPHRGAARGPSLRVPGSRGAGREWGDQCLLGADENDRGG